MGRTTKHIFRLQRGHRPRSGAWCPAGVLGICGRVAAVLFFSFTVLFGVSSCARMGQPDGGWYDETPPRVVGSTPADKATGISGRKIRINFDEFIKIDNPTENVVVSPPQMEAPEIKGQGKSIVVELKDSLKPNTTYTIDFSDAITDNNEDNPLGNFTYSFSTGNEIDTMEVSGHVLEAETLEPVKGILVGLYANLEDSAFRKLPMLRVSKTDSRGRFVIKGVAPGSYRIYALQDVDGDYRFSQKSEKLAFNHDVIVPSWKPDVRQDTLWRDSLHIDSIVRVGYTHFLPDDIVLRAFTEVLTDRYFIKAERQDANHFTLFYSYGSNKLPEVKGLNFNAADAFLVEANEKRDTITYWLRDTALVNQDTLSVQLAYEMTDSAGQLVTQTDTLHILSKQPYARRMKDLQRRREDWQKRQDRARKRGNKYETVWRPEALKPEIKAPSQLDPDQNIFFSFPVPLAEMDTSKVHLYSKIDSLWYRARFLLRPYPSIPRTYELYGEWRPGVEYSLEVDSAAFRDIYGNVSDKLKQGFKVRNDDEYTTIVMNLEGMSGRTVICQLLNKQDKVQKQVVSTSGTAEFFYVKPDTYYLRMIVDENANGRWDTGNYDLDRQPEEVYYYPEKIECRAKWEVRKTWQPAMRRLDEQKPAEITQQKADKKKTIKYRNAERARKMGVPLPANVVTVRK